MAGQSLNADGSTSDKVVLYIGGQPVGSGNPIPTSAGASPAGAGSGTDASSSPPSVASLATLATFTVTTPGAYRVQNQSAATVYVALGAIGSQTLFALGPAAASGGQGGDTSPEPTWFTGTVTVYGPTGAAIAVRHA